MITKGNIKENMYDSSTELKILIFHSVLTLTSLKQSQGLILQLEDILGIPRCVYSDRFVFL